MELELESLLSDEMDDTDDVLDFFLRESADCERFGGVTNSILAVLIPGRLLFLLVGDGTTDVDVGRWTFSESFTMELIFFVLILRYFLF